MNSPLVFSSLICLLLASQYACAGDWMTWRSTYTHDPATGHRVEQFAAPVEPLAPDQGNLVRSGYRHYRSTIQAGETADSLHVVTEWGRPVVPYEHWRFPYRPFGVPYGAWGPPTPGVYSNFHYSPHFGHPHHQPGAAGHSGAVGAPAGPAPGSPPGAGNGAWGAAGYPGTSSYGAGYPYGSGYGPGSGYGSGYGGYPGGYPPAYPGGSSAYPLVPPFQPAPWYDGFYPPAPSLESQPDPQFFYRPPQSLAP